MGPSQRGWRDIPSLIGKGRSSQRSASRSWGNPLPGFQGFTFPSSQTHAGIFRQQCIHTHIHTHAWSEGPQAEGQCTVCLLAAPVGSALRNGTSEMAKFTAIWILTHQKPFSCSLLGWRNRQLIAAKMMGSANPQKVLTRSCHTDFIYTSYIVPKHKVLSGFWVTLLMPLPLQMGWGGMGQDRMGWHGMAWMSGENADGQSPATSFLGSRTRCRSLRSSCNCAFRGVSATLGAGCNPGDEWPLFVNGHSQ